MIREWAESIHGYFTIPYLKLYEIMNFQYYRERDISYFVDQTFDSFPVMICVILVAKDEQFTVFN